MQIRNVLLMIFIMVLLVGAALYWPKQTGNVIYDQDIIVVPVSVHLVDDGTIQYTTQRDLENIQQLFEETNRIWSQAQIEFVLEDVDVIEVENSDFYSVALNGDISKLIERDDFDTGFINGYFARYIAANGVAFPPQGVFIVADITTVNDFRTTAHELGHLLDLTHEEERDFLMFKGSNGEFLSQENIDLARRNARGIYEI